MKYRALEVTAIDSGRTAPVLRITLYCGEDAAHSCVARKKFALVELDEVRDLIAWSLEAYAAAFDQLHEDGWAVVHIETCKDYRGMRHAEA